MYAVDFEYDGLRLSDFGCVIGRIDGSPGIEVVSAGSNITFNKVKRHRGKIHALTSTTFDECITATFQIFKDPCSDMEMTSDEYRALARWLNRHKFLPFHFIAEEGDSRATCYHEASFNFGKVLNNDTLVGIELTMETNRPFGYGDTVTTTLNVSNTSNTYTITDYSDDVGYTYPNMTITLAAAGTLTITNSTTGSVTELKNCSSGEVITINGDTMVVTSSLSAHHIYDDFNFEYLKIANSYSSRTNSLTFSLRCTAVISYKPNMKESPE